MDPKRSFTIQSLLVTLVFNIGLTLAILYLSGDPLFTGGGLTPTTSTILIAALVITLLLWLVILTMGRRAIDQAAVTALANAQPAPAKSVSAQPPAPPKPAKPTPPSTAPAVQILAMLQREGRLIDFLQEDLALYQDDQIGAAVRSVHAGCNKVLSEHVELAPIYDEAEGSTITVPVGFDANRVRLSGNVVGDPPFSGALRHRGWQAEKIDLPQQMQGGDDKIIAPAEIEVGG